MASTKGLLLLITLLLAAAFLVAGAAEQTQAKKGEMEAGLPRGYRRGGAGAADAHGSGCLIGCCKFRVSGGCRCCANADEVPEPMYRPAAEAHN